MREYRSILFAKPIVLSACLCYTKSTLIERTVQMNDALNIYNFSGFGVTMEDNCMTIKGVQLTDILNEYSVEDIVEALCDTDKDADVIEELAKRSEEE